MDTMAQWYPKGFAFVKTGDASCFTFLSNDALIFSVWKAGVHIGDIRCVTADGTPLKMLMQEPKSQDGVSYPSIWVKNDGQEVTIQISQEQREALIAIGISQIYLNEKLITL